MTTENEGRDSRGRFLKGNRGGPGNPHMRRTAAMRREVAEAFEEGELRPLMKMLMIRALQGDMAAARLVLEYTVGKPAKAADPDLVDVNDLEVRRRTWVRKEDIGLVTSMAAWMLCEIAEWVGPAVCRQHFKTLGDMMMARPEWAEDIRRARASREANEANAPNTPNGGQMPTEGD